MFQHAGWLLSSMNLKLLPNTNKSPFGLAVSLALFLGLSTAHSQTKIEPQFIDLSLSKIVDSALQRSPDYRLPDAYSELSQAHQERSKQWLASSPSISFAYQTDDVDMDAGFAESLISLTLPIWRWDQKQAFRTLAASSSEFSELYPKVLRLDVSAQVRSTVWAVEEAQTEVDLAIDALGITEQLEAKVRRQVELGNVPRTDLIAAQRERLVHQANFIKSEVDREVQLESYRSLTGLDQYPSNINEELSDKSHDTNPKLLLHQIVVEQTEAEWDVVKTSGNGQPELTVGGRQERPDRFTDSQQYLSIELSVPVGGRRYNAIDLAESFQKSAVARRDYRRLELSLETALKTTKSQLGLQLKQLSTTKQLLMLAEEKYAMDQRAYGSGVMSLLELLRSQTALLGSKRDYQLLQIKIGRTRAEINQLSGVSL